MLYGSCLAAVAQQWSSKAAVEMLLSALAEIAEEDGMPPGAIDVAPASHDKSAEIGQALTSSQAVQMISFQIDARRRGW